MLDGFEIALGRDTSTYISANVTDKEVNWKS